MVTTGNAHQNNQNIYIHPYILKECGKVCHLVGASSSKVLLIFESQCCGEDTKDCFSFILYGRWGGGCLTFPMVTVLDEQLSQKPLKIILKWRMVKHPLTSTAPSPNIAWRTRPLSLSYSLPSFEERCTQLPMGQDKLAIFWIPAMKNQISLYRNDATLGSSFLVTFV